MTPAGLLAFVVPGLLLAWFGDRLRAAWWARGVGARVGVVLVQLSALGFALQGVFAPADAQGVRLHAFAWTLWWIAFVPGVLLQAVSGRRDRVFACGCVVAALLVPALSLFAPAVWGPAFAKLLAIAAWGGWWLLAAWRVRAESPVDRIRRLRGD